MTRARSVTLALGLSLLLPLSAGAGVEVLAGASGRKIITNESSADRGRRLAPRMVAPPRTELLPLIEAHADAQDLDPQLVRAVVQAESGYNVRALSNKGAQGLMQLMPGTAEELEVEDAFDPSENIRGGTTYLRRMIDAFGSTELALAAYNAGPGAVERYGGIPPYKETIQYVQRVLGLWHGKPMALTGAKLQPRGSRVEWQKRPGGRLLLTNQP